MPRDPPLPDGTDLDQPDPLILAYIGQHVLGMRRSY
jgi:hypothetical protein